MTSEEEKDEVLPVSNRKRKLEEKEKEKVGCAHICSRKGYICVVLITTVVAEGGEEAEEDTLWQSGGIR